MTEPVPPVILIPGYWLGGWAWSAVAGQLRSAGLTVTSLTLPGLESRETSREGVRFADHVGAVLDALPEEGRAVLVAHSGAGAVVTAVLDRVPERVARVIYVESGPSAAGSVPRPDLDPEAADLPLPSFDEFEAEGASLEGLDQSALRRFRESATPHPVGAITEPIELRNPRRNDVPATVVCCSFPSALVAQATDDTMFAPLRDLTDVTYVDLPSGHWPMWSRPEELASLIEEAART